MTTSTAELVGAIERLHRAKDAAYGNAWKKRGEVIGVLANIARKVDRLDSVLGGAPPTEDESLFDTAVDLLVYSLKYQAYLSDLDPAVARELFDAQMVAPPYSDGPSGVEYLLAAVTFPGEDTPSVVAAAEGAAAAFSDLEACFELATAAGPPIARLEEARALTAAAAALVCSLMRDTPSLYDDFIAVR